jgi:hypothetical protein
MGESGFRIVFLWLIIVAYIAATNIISPESKYEITLFFNIVIDLWVFKMFGVKIEEDIK